jgi:hypothetical protein
VGHHVVLVRAARGGRNLAVGREVVQRGTADGSGLGFVVEGHKRFSLFGLRRKMGSFGIFPFWVPLWGADAPAPPESMVALRGRRTGRIGGMCVESRGDRDLEFGKWVGAREILLASASSTIKLVGGGAGSRAGPAPRSRLRLSGIAAQREAQSGADFAHP